MSDVFDPDIYDNISSRNLNDCGCDDGITPNRDLVITPRVLYFLYQEIGTSSDPQTISITNTSDKLIGLGSITSTGVFSLLGFLPTEIPSGETVSFQVRFNPSATGLSVGSILIDAGDGSLEPYKVELFGVGGQSDLANQVYSLEGRVVVLEATALDHENRIAALEENAQVPILSGYLTKNNVAVSADPYGNVSDFNAAESEFIVTFGGERVITGVAFTVVEETNVNVSINSLGSIEVVSMPLGQTQGSATFRAQYQGQIVDLIYSINKIKDVKATSYLSLSRKSISLMGYEGGSVVDYDDAEGQATVWSSGENVTNDAVLIAIQIGLVGTINTADNVPVNGKPKGYYRVTNLTGEIGTLEVQATYGGATYTEVFTVSRSNVGVEIVDELPATGNWNGRLVFLTSDGKLYRYVTGTGWTAEVPASDITGQLTNEQLEQIAAAKLTGQITKTQIADGSIETPKLAAGAVLTANLGAGSVVAEKIAAGAITTPKIEAGAIVATKLAANSVTADKILAGSITAAKLATTELITLSAQIGTGVITNAKIANLSVDNAKIANLTVGTSKISVGAITVPSMFSASDTFINASGSEITVIETGILTVGDADDGQAVILAFGEIDSGSTKDLGGRLRIYVDTGSGYILMGTTGAGIRTADGNTFFKATVLASAIVPSASTIKVKVTMASIYINSSTYREFYFRSPQLCVMGAKR
jgi:hypothetical protein